MEYSWSANHSMWGDFPCFLTFRTNSMSLNSTTNLGFPCCGVGCGPCRKNSRHVVSMMQHSVLIWFPQIRHYKLYVGWLWEACCTVIISTLVVRYEVAATVKTPSVMTATQTVSSYASMVASKTDSTLLTAAAFCTLTNSRMKHAAQCIRNCILLSQHYRFNFSSCSRGYSKSRILSFWILALYYTVCTCAYVVLVSALC